MIEVQFTKDHGRFSKGERRWYDDNSAEHLVKSKVARRVNHTDSPEVETAEVVTAEAPEE
ncbi:hypothetical protein [Rhodococcus artemisiae]|uniref:Uncharacterized protein n=1 Tax=Rhodococcus artemisiae TaxID=714159 RepID=A0ABU7LBQ5_9NOCA|nr:hypothetical protein [Rhodococcus artemisiae]MEE2058974.1 hypothetical protein [Rhodococcus artemisiae]